MILHLNGWDATSEANLGNKYNVSGGFVQGGAIPGRFGGLAAQMVNTGFGEHNWTTRQLGQRKQWTLGLAFGPSDFSGLTTIGTAVWLRFEYLSAAGTQLAVKLTTAGRLEFYSGGLGTNAHPGTLIASPGYQFVYGGWNYLELVLSFGTHGTLEMWVDDDLKFSSHNINIGTNDPDRMTLRWEAFGFLGVKFDDLYLTDGDRLGPVRITTLFPTVDAGGSGFVRNTGAADWTAVDDSFLPGHTVPDADATYIRGLSGAFDLFGLGTFPCFARILGVGFNANARAVTGVSTVSFQAKPDPTQLTITQIGVSPALPTTYGTYQAIAGNSLASGGIWKDRELRRGLWGVGVGVGSIRVSQFFIEKLTTLRAGVSFDCGTGTYAY